MMYSASQYYGYSEFYLNENLVHIERRSASKVPAEVSFITAGGQYTLWNN